MKPVSRPAYRFAMKFVGNTVKSAAPANGELGALGVRESNPRQVETVGEQLPECKPDHVYPGAGVGGFLAQQGCPEIVEPLGGDAAIEQSFGLCHVGGDPLLLGLVQRLDTSSTTLDPG